jgi:hypothetical protein
LIGSGIIPCRRLIPEALGVARPISDEGERLLVVKARQVFRCPARARNIVTGSRKRPSQVLRLGVLGIRQEKSLTFDRLWEGCIAVGEARVLSDKKEELIKELKSGQS